MDKVADHIIVFASVGVKVSLWFMELFKEKLRDRATEYWVSKISTKYETSPISSKYLKPSLGKLKHIPLHNID
jgi:hypothetical protein